MSRSGRSRRQHAQRSVETVAPAQATAGQPRSRGRRVTFRIVALGSPLIILGALNLVLYCAGVGHDTRMLVPFADVDDGHTFRMNEEASLAYYDQRDLAGPDGQPFRLPRPNGTYRILVMGASTVEGFPYYTELSFPRQIGVFLKRQLPGRHFEVLNAGIVGLNSFALVDLLPRLLACEPDLIVVYAGHN